MIASTGLLGNRARAAVDTLRHWTRLPNLAVIDTETTGLRGEVIEVGVVSLTGAVLFRQRVRPVGRVERSAFEVHGISDDELKGEPGMPEVWPKLRRFFVQRRLVAFNALFDLDALQASLDAALPGWEGQLRANGLTGSDEFAVFRRRTRCAMRRLAPITGDWSERRGNYRFPKLATSMEILGVSDTGRGHAAVYDAHATARVIRAAAMLERMPAGRPGKGELGGECYRASCERGGASVPVSGGYACEACGRAHGR